MPFQSVDMTIHHKIHWLVFPATGRPESVATNILYNKFSSFFDGKVLLVMHNSLNILPVTKLILD